MLFLLTAAALAGDRYDDLDDLDSDYNSEIETTKTVVLHPVTLLFGAAYASAEFRLPDTSASLMVGAIGYTFTGAWDTNGVGLTSIFQARRYVLGDFDRGLYVGSHLNATYAQDALFTYYSGAVGAVTGGKWVVAPGFTLDQHWGVAYYSDWGVDWFVTVGVGWSW